MGALEPQLVHAWQLCSELGLGNLRNYSPPYPSGLPGELRRRGYRDGYSFLLANRLFDFQFQDGSILQFRAGTEGGHPLLSYSYYEVPFDIPTYADFLIQELGTTEEEVGEFFIEDYEQVVREADLKASVTPIRYDYSPNLYREGVHPASHFHIGYDNQVRIALERILTPSAFILFVIRHCYPDSWTKLISEDSAIARVRRLVREDLETVPKHFWKGTDLVEVSLR